MEYDLLRDVIRPEEIYPSARMFKAAQSGKLQPPALVHLSNLDPEALSRDNNDSHRL